MTNLGIKRKIKRLEKQIIGYYDPDIDDETSHFYMFDYEVDEYNASIRKMIKRLKKELI